MPTENIVDYLGHPSQLALALARLDYQLPKSRKLEQRDLVRSIGILLNELMDRIGHSNDVLELARDTLASTGEDEQIHALLEMAVPYEVESCNKLCELGGHVLAALEQANMTQANLVEAAHA